MEKNTNFSLLKILLFISLAIFISVALIVSYKMFMPNFSHKPIFEYFSTFDQKNINIVLYDNMIPLSNFPIKKNDEIFIPSDFIKEYIDKHLFWDKQQNLIITNTDSIYSFNSKKNLYFLNNEPYNLPGNIFFENNVAYIPSTFLSSIYDLDIKLEEEFNLLIIDFKFSEKTVAKLTSDKITLRYEPSIKSAIEYNLLKDEVLVLNTVDDFMKIRAKNGLIGYVKSKYVSDIHTVKILKNTKSNTKTEKFPNNINLLWDLITTFESNTVSSKKIYHDGVNVLSPTWFSLDEDLLDGSFSDLASKAYVNWAHSNNYQVWALVSDGSSSKIPSTVLSNTESRQNAIQNLLKYVEIYNLDGLNIDFEKITPDYSKYFIQFLRELKPLADKKNIILSVDLLVPKYTKYYNRTAISEVVDYVCLMSYDEYTSVSEGAGPVASIDFVKTAIIQTLEEVPNKKLVMGIPLYSRIWQNNKIHSIYGMNRSRSIFESNGATFVWDDNLKLNFGQYTKTEKNNEFVYKVWIEDLDAIDAKMQLFKQYDLKGVALWQRSLANDDVFDILKNYLE